MKPSPELLELISAAAYCYSERQDKWDDFAATPSVITEISAILGLDAATLSAQLDYKDGYINGNAFAYYAGQLLGVMHKCKLEIIAKPHQKKVETYNF